MSSDDNAHSSSGYYMLTGHPHQPKNFKNANPGPPNDHPSLGAVVNKLHMGSGVLRPSVTLPNRIFNTDGSVWPGQTAGFLGRNADPWLFTFNPAAPSLRIDDFALPADVPPTRLEGRCSLLQQLDGRLDSVEGSGLLDHFDKRTREAFDLLRTESRKAFQLDQEPASVRERYGHSPLAQRPFGPPARRGRRDAGTGQLVSRPRRAVRQPLLGQPRQGERALKTVLVPPFDLAYSALLEDLSARGMLDETLVVCLAELAAPRRSATAAGATGGTFIRSHWRAEAFAGDKPSRWDKIGGLPKEGRVQPEDLTATIFHCLGYAPNVELPDALGRPQPISRGDVIRQAL